MRIEIRVFAVLLAATTFSVFVPASAQSPVTVQTFEVVSIKRNISVPGPGFFSSVSERPDGGLIAANVPVATLISRAYPSAVPIADLPGWASTDRYDVTATSSLSVATADDRTAMLRAMLADRFKRTLHFEKREQPAYDLVVARSDRRLGPGITPLDIDCERIAAERTAATATTAPAPPQVPDFKAAPPLCTVRMVGASVRDRRGDQLGRLGDLLEGETTADNLAKALRMTVGRLVVNKTALVGSYRVAMNFDGMSGRGGPAVTVTDSAPSIFAALQEQLGLKLEASHMDLDTVVIDRLERPTEN